MTKTYRAETIAEGMHVCISGDDYMSAPLYDTREEAEEAANRMNARFYADGRPANAQARLMVGAA